MATGEPPELRHVTHVYVVTLTEEADPRREFSATHGGFDLEDAYAVLAEKYMDYHKEETETRRGFQRAKEDLDAAIEKMRETGKQKWKYQTEEGLQIEWEIITVKIVGNPGSAGPSSVPRKTKRSRRG